MYSAHNNIVDPRGEVWANMCLKFVAKILTNRSDWCWGL